VNDEARFLDVVLAEPTAAAVLERAPQVAWGTDEGPSCPPSLARSGRDLARGPTGARDADLFHFDPDTSWDAEDAVNRRGAALDDDLAGAHRVALETTANGPGDAPRRPDQCRRA
jgi:uncharacterized protein